MHPSNPVQVTTNIFYARHATQNNIIQNNIIQQNIIQQNIDQPRAEPVANTLLARLNTLFDTIDSPQNTRIQNRSLESLLSNQSLVLLDNNQLNQANNQNEINDTIDPLNNLDLMTGIETNSLAINESLTIRPEIQINSDLNQNQTETNSSLNIDQSTLIQTRNQNQTNSPLNTNQSSSIQTRNQRNRALNQGIPNNSTAEIVEQLPLNNSTTPPTELDSRIQARRIAIPHTTFHQNTQTVPQRMEYLPMQRTQPHNQFFVEADIPSQPELYDDRMDTSSLSSNSSNPPLHPQRALYNLDDILLSTKLIAYLSKYPEIRQKLHEQSIFISLEHLTDPTLLHILLPYTTANPDVENDMDYFLNDGGPIRPVSSPQTIQEIRKWSLICLRNAFKKEQEDSLRRCGNLGCKLYERKHREFSKCSRCRRVSYCS